jgi:hypothetical protein
MVDVRRLQRSRLERRCGCEIAQTMAFVRAEYHADESTSSRSVTKISEDRRK